MHPNLERGSCVHIFKRFAKLLAYWHMLARDLFEVGRAAGSNAGANRTPRRLQFYESALAAVRAVMTTGTGAPKEVLPFEVGLSDGENGVGEQPFEGVLHVDSIPCTYSERPQHVPLMY